MRKGVVTVRQTASVEEAAKLLTENNVGSVIVMRVGVPAGIVTERDIVSKVVSAGKDPVKTEVGSVMSSPIKAIGPEIGVDECARIMRDEQVKRLPVIDRKGKLIGIISETDVVRVSPALFDIIRERAELERFGAGGAFTGACESCSNYSETLEKTDEGLFCAECRAKGR